MREKERENVRDVGRAQHTYMDYAHIISAEHNERKENRLHFTLWQW